MCILNSCTRFVWDFFIRRRIERGIIIMYIGLHVKYLLVLSDCKKTLIFSTDVQQLVKYLKSVKIRWVRAELFHAGGRKDKTDMTKPIIAFRSFAKVPENCPFAHEGSTRPRCAVLEKTTCKFELNLPYTLVSWIMACLLTVQVTA